MQNRILAGVIPELAYGGKTDLGSGGQCDLEYEGQGDLGAIGRLDWSMVNIE